MELAQVPTRLEGAEDVTCTGGRPGVDERPGAEGSALAMGSQLDRPWGPSAGKSHWQAVFLAGGGGGRSELDPGR